ncbi:terminase, partial [Escherichia coli]
SDAYQSFSLATFYNTSLGETFDDLNADIDCSELEKLIDDVSVNNIPDDVVFLVAGGDQQKDRLENTLIGVSEKALYVLDHRSFYDMDCEKPDSPAYTKLIDFLKSDFRTVSGQKIPMLWANLDAGNGRASQSVYRNCNRWG